ncbi:McrB family protein [Paenibacillus sp. UNC451MF]|uniref:McrB family protein n=1 Tax=Paenibacillus sp. UNC451MF TaxID=1449063 RepID=UPI00068A9011|nr:hypothetical protein [Paenibacillus sp. UNC451MF]
MNIKRIEELLAIPETSERCERVHDEVQPVLLQLMDAFRAQYGGLAPELQGYQVHTYEMTLRTTMHDARNPKYAPKKQDTDIGKRAFIELVDKSLFQTEIGVLRLEFNGLEKQFKIIIPSSFYPFWVAVRSQSNEKGFVDLLEKLDPEIRIQVADKEGQFLAKDEWITYLQKAVDDKRRPWFHIGILIPFAEVASEAELMESIWETYTKLQPIREYIQREAEQHALSLKVLSLLNEHHDDIPLTLYGKTYDIKFEEAYDYKSNNRRQKFGLYEKGQLVADGMFDQYLRDPYEVLGIFVNGYGHIYTNLRQLSTETQYPFPWPWYITKSFRYHKQDGKDINKEYQLKAFEALAAHDFEVRDTSFYVGSYDTVLGRFKESAAEVKKVFVAAALLFADISQMITLPRIDAASTQNSQEESLEDLAEIMEEAYEHNFDLSVIMANIGDSELTYSPSIIRDFHLNLVSLEDKHFVILNGISGTGKTQLCLLYANAVYGQPRDHINPYVKVIPVRPDWTDSTALFGYYSALEKRYVRTPFLNALLQAIHEGKPMFIVLDEMNLARVEYYLSDYLSAVESKQPVQLHTEEHVTDVPQVLHIPNNLYVIGTINVDETTHSISDKVLDRAFVMTLTDVDLDSFWNGTNPKYKSALAQEWGLLQELHGKLHQYDLHFGYRTLNEMIRKLYVNAQLDPGIRMEPVEAVDRVVAEKVLPKIRGDERIAPLLLLLNDWMKASLGEGSESLRHVKRMREELDRYGAAQFWR